MLNRRLRLASYLTSWATDTALGIATTLALLVALGVLGVAR